MTMKTSNPIGRCGWLAALFQFSVAAFAEDRPQITSVRLDGTNIVVIAKVPVGLRKLTLESRSRLEAGAWIPQTVVRFDGTGGEWTFRLPRTARFEMLRVRADTSELFPASFYQGTNEFVGPPGSGGLQRGLEDAPVSGTADKAADRAVVESDIWKIDDDTLYFFNQYRGLQVIDISNPEMPPLRGALALPATGEQMYVIDHYAVLLTRDCSGSSGQSTVLIVDTKVSPPKVIRRLTVEGTIQESHMVGAALYEASETYRPLKDGDPKLGTTWEWGSIVSSFDLADPSAPATQDTLGSQVRVMLSQRHTASCLSPAALQPIGGIPSSTSSTFPTYTGRSVHRATSVRAVRCRTNSRWTSRGISSPWFPKLGEIARNGRACSRISRSRIRRRRNDWAVSLSRRANDFSPPALTATVPMW
ncbi:MAG: hypothetical protein EXS36_01925 [Pedosphaera sp.]|nr:hypothetical protein [Pedosphaera sp.]